MICSTRVSGRAGTCVCESRSLPMLVRASFNMITLCEENNDNINARGLFFNAFIESLDPREFILSGHQFTSG